MKKNGNGRSNGAVRMAPDMDPELQELLRPVIERFTEEMARVFCEAIEGKVNNVVTTALRNATLPRGTRPCRVSGCARPARGPRNDFFCDEHKHLTALQKAEIKAGANGEAG